MTRLDAKAVVRAYIDAGLASGTGTHAEIAMLEAPEVWAAIEQSKAKAPAGQVPALHFAKEGEGWHVAVPLDDWLILLALAINSRPKACDCERPLSDGNGYCSKCGKAEK